MLRSRGSSTARFWSSLAAGVTITAGALGTLVTPAGSPVDAAATPSPTIHYTFDGALTDANGASTATPAAACPTAPCNSAASFGSDADGGFWTWTSTNAASGGGFVLSTTSVVGDTYTLALKFSFSEVSPGYRKIIDYEDRTSDNGFYFLDSALLFYPYTSQASSTTYAADTVLDLVAVRQSTGGATGTFTVYAVGPNGLLTLLFTANDTDGSSIPISNGSGGTKLGFFFDDTAVQNEATASGKVYDLKIWANQALTQAELEDVITPPSTPPVAPAVPVAPSFTG